MSQLWNVDQVNPSTSSPAMSIQPILDAFNALRSNFSGTAEPVVEDQVPFMWWADTANDQLKMRNAANTAWIVVGKLSVVNLGLISVSGGNLTGGINGAKTTVASSATPDIFATTVGGLVEYTGTSVATGFVGAPQPGAHRTLYCTSTPGFTASANLLIDGVASGQTYTAAAGELIDVVALTTTQFQLQPKGLFSGRALTRPQTVAFSATPTINVALSNYFEVGVLTGNITTLTISNPIAGQTITIRFKQDGTGGRSVASPAGAKISGAIDTTANAVSHLTMTYALADARWEGYWSSVPA